MQGASVDPQGRLRVVNAAPSVDAKFNGGIAIEPDGRMCVETHIPSANSMPVGGLLVEPDGRLCIATTGGAPASYVKAMPISALGELFGIIDSFVPNLATFNDGIAMDSNRVYMTTTPAPPKPTTRFDLTQFPLDPRITFTRGSVGTYWDQNGVLQAAAVNEPRPYRNAGEAAILGLMIEEASTNEVRNNTMQGAGINTPPVNWFISGLTAPQSGLSSTIVGQGTDHGINYIDWHIEGTTDSAISLGAWFDQSTVIPCVAGEVWSGSFFAKLLAGSFPAQAQCTIIERGAAGVFVQNTVTPIAVTGAELNTQRFSTNRTISSDPNTLYVQNAFSFASIDIGTVVNFTVRIGLPQLEKKSSATSPIKTQTVAVTRQFDLPQITGANFSPWWNPIEGTFSVKSKATRAGAANIPLGIRTSTAVFGDAAYMTYQSDGLNCLLGPAAAPMNLTSSVASSSSEGTMVVGLKANDSVFAMNGVLGPVDAACGMTQSATGLVLGSSCWSTLQGLSNINGYVASIDYWNTRLTDGQIQELSY